MLIETAKQELAQIDQLYKRWLIGGQGTTAIDTQLPKSWPELDQNLSHSCQRRQALILASAQRSWLLAQSEPQELLTKPPLPQLEFVTLVDDLRGLFKRCLEQTKQFSPSKINHLLNILAQHKVSAHPADWLPKQNDDVPALYWPWLAWVTQDNQSQQSLTADNWSQFLPAQRIELLHALRRDNPQQAREIIAQCAANEPAERRYKVIDTLAIKLSQQDIEYLNSLANDRSKKVVELSTQLLMRLGENLPPTDDQRACELADELAAWLTVKTSGLFKKTKHVVAAPLKSKKQQALRSEWLEQVSLIHLAQALSLSPRELVENWQFSQHRYLDNYNFITNVARHAPDEIIQIVITRLRDYLNEEQHAINLLELLLPRLSSDERQKLVSEIMSHNKAIYRFDELLPFTDQPIGAIQWRVLAKTLAWKTLEQQIIEQIEKTSYLEQSYATRGIIALGLLVSSDCAKQIIERLVKLGMLNVDPVFDCLKLNIKLSELQ